MVLNRIDLVETQYCLRQTGLFISERRPLVLHVRQVFGLTPAQKFLFIVSPHSLTVTFFYPSQILQHPRKSRPLFVLFFSSLSALRAFF